MRRPQPDHLRPEVGIAIDEVGGNDSGLEDVAGAVDVGEEEVQRPDPLLEAARQAAPFRPGQDARDDVEGDDPLFGLVVAIDGEGDADAAEEEFGLGPPVGKGVARGAVQPALDDVITRTAGAVGPRHFVECCRHRPFRGRSILERLARKTPTRLGKGWNPINSGALPAHPVRQNAGQGVLRPSTPPAAK